MTTLLNWQELNKIALGLIAYIVLELVLSIWKDTPKRFGQHIFGIVRHQWKELVYLRGILKEQRFAQWKPESQHYVALHAIRAKKDSYPFKIDSGESKTEPTPLLELLQTHLKLHDSVLILGDPGAGKTSALEALAYRLAYNAYRKSILAWFINLLVAAIILLWSPMFSLIWLGIFSVVFNRVRFWVTPFFLELRSFFSENAYEFVATAIKNELGDDALLKTKRHCLLLLDGVNEIHRNQNSRFLETWRQQKSMPLTFFTSRSGEKPDLDIPIVLAVCELDDEGVQAFIGVYLQERVTNKKDGIEQKKRRIYIDLEFSELKRLGLLLADGGIGRNPYWLRMLVLSGLRTRNRGVLFLNFVFKLLRRETEIKPLERKRTPEWATVVPVEIEMQVLAELAYRMNLDYRVIFNGKRDYEVAREIIRNALGNRKILHPEDVLVEAQSATLIDYQENAYIKFSHQLVQEFFAAYALRAEADWDVTLAEDPSWWETLFILGGLIAIPEAGGSIETWTRFLQRILNGNQSDMRLFAAIGLLRSIESPDPAMSSIVLETFASSVSNKLEPRHQRAVHELERILGDEAIDTFVAMFHSADSHLRIKGTTLLCAAESKRASETVIDTLHDLVRGKEIVEILVSIGIPAVKILLLALQNEDPYVRRISTDALGEIGATQVIEPLIAGLQDADLNVARAAIKALGKIGASRAVSPLVSTLTHEDYNMRQSAAEALGQIGDPDAVMPLIKTLKDNNEGVRQRVEIALGNFTQAVEPLLAMITRESLPHWAEVASIASALGQLADKKALPSLQALLPELQISVEYREKEIKEGEADREIYRGAEFGGPKYKLMLDEVMLIEEEIRNITLAIEKIQEAIVKIQKNNDS